MPRRSLLAAAALFAGTTLAAQANTFRWANDGDVNSMDPYARNETFLLSFNANIYEPLVRRNRQLAVEPALAARWEQPSPTVWRFHLREGVRFSDGTPLSADDVLFSFERARGPGSNITAYFASVKEARVVSPSVIEFETHRPNPIFVEEITGWGIMSRAWAERNSAQRVADLTQRAENFATRNAMGTGPFVLVSREPDRRTVLAPNPAWWDRPEHNLTRVEFNVIANDATRVAALISGEVDMVYTVPPQDTDRLSRSPGIRIHQQAELRTIYLGMDQSREELLKSDVRGRNPFRDVRVRRAMQLAIDNEAIARTVMRGQARPTALMIGPGVNGHTEELDRALRVRPNPEEARRLLAEAGYPNGFQVGMDCPNDRYVNDEAICTAVVAMLARVGIRVQLNAQTRARYFAEILGPRYNTSFFMLGWTPPTYDAHNALFNLMGTRDGTRGVFNSGGYSNPRFDALVEQIATETDRARRQELINQAMRIHAEDVGHIPLHQQVVIWAARQNITLQQLADNYFPLRFVRVGQ
ncbi:ABC transporter substrate-binding protein [Roseomonas alkaliterrae]|uniref:Peptide/nickel transport system substrate-binding protein n=1 Tax=Neoroseomonas alkaliterrae TaxID=1452450 RepID=A0A840Y236_9PROT|nr:ABC transporter substrate-binding protein [Neoroseomonas alkaliterrae]MBB5690437.1 peptide/nickel transport system substrate-binding protein [Neoroseomonas alkaliterrae]MBR0677169.1 ABC transporter substrate-binding protein [Neoroseomonas alkaliterrae]